MTDSDSELSAKCSETVVKLAELSENYSTTLNQFNNLVRKYYKVVLRTGLRSKLGLD